MNTALRWAISSASALTSRSLTVLILKAKRQVSSLPVPRASAGAHLVSHTSHGASANIDGETSRSGRQACGAGRQQDGYLHTCRILGVPVPDLHHMQDGSSVESEHPCHSFHASKAFNNLITLCTVPEQWRNGSELVRPYTNLAQKPLA